MVKFPLFPIIDGKCGCGDESCTRAGKHPAWPFSKLTTESAPVAEGAGYGICTGSRSGVFVVDLDVRPDKDGVRNFEAMGSCPETYMVATPTGGVHLYFRLPDFLVPNSASTLGPGIDVRGEGGFVVGPGSGHRNGGIYSAIQADVAEAPDWLLTRLRVEAAGRIVETNQGVRVIPVSAESPEFDRRTKIAQQFLRDVPVCISGQGGQGQIWTVCCELIRKLELPLETCKDLILAGYNDRCLPPWPEQDIIRCLDNAATKGMTPTGIAPENWHLRATPGEELPIAARAEERGRKAKDAAHRYTFEPGVHVCMSDMAKGKSTLEMITRVLTDHPDWAGVWQYNEFKREILAVNPPMKLDAEWCGVSSRDVTAIQLWFEFQGFITMRESVENAVQVAAMTNSFHPVREYLEQLPPATGYLDHIERLWSGTEMEGEFLKRTLVAACKRILRPGTKVDTILVLYGKQGFYKSTFVKKLFDPWYRDQMPELNGRDASHALEGFWGIELAELDKLSRLESSTIKDFLSRQVDKYRQFGNGNKVEYQRECVFIGTTNDDGFLRDATGNRRYLPIIVRQPIDLTFDRDKIWAAAFELARLDYPHWLNWKLEEEAQVLREPFVQTDPWTPVIIKFLKGKEFVTSDEVLSQLVQMNANKDYKSQKRVTDTLKRIGCNQRLKKIAGEAIRGWNVPETVSGPLKEQKSN